MKRLREHDRVFVSVPQGFGHGFEAIVLVFSERGMTMQATDKLRVMRLPDVVPGALVTFRHDKALIALPGKLVRVEPLGDLRFQVSELSLRRERGTRFKFKMPLTVRPEDSEVETEATTIDLGPDGLLIECDLDSVGVGDQLVISFTAPQSGETVAGIADIVRGPIDGLLALHLPSESVEARNALGGMVVAISRASLARAMAPKGDEDGGDF